MSFINIEAKSTKKFVPREIKCSNCTEPNLRLKWYRKDEQGRNEYWDLDSNAVHLCKTKYLKDLVQCKRCGTKGLRKHKGELYTVKGKPHECDFSNLYTPMSKEDIERIEKARKYYDYFYRNT